jgi:hypothetical protein
VIRIAYGPLSRRHLAATPFLIALFIFSIISLDAELCEDGFCGCGLIGFLNKLVRLEKICEGCLLLLLMETLVDTAALGAAGDFSCVVGGGLREGNGGHAQLEGTQGGLEGLREGTRNGRAGLSHARI